MTRVLVVEDQRTLVRNLEKGLQEEGYEVIAAASITEARRALMQQPDLIVLDATLPDGIAIELLRQSRGQGISQPVFGSHRARFR